jgi:PAS domain S-box-containing protein
MRILVVDDHELIRRGIRTVLAAEPSLTVCGEAVDGQEAVQKADSLRPDIVLMDISMPRLNGLEATREIKRLIPDAEILIVSQHESAEMIRQAFRAGASGYVVKSTISTDLLSAIIKVSHKEPFVSAASPASTIRPLDPQEILRRSAAFEKALRESEERFRSAMNNLAEGLYTLDADGLVTYINPSAEEMFGWSSAELLGKRIHDVIHYKHPDGTPYPAADCPGVKMLHDGVRHRDHEDVFIRKDGSFFPVALSASPLNIEGHSAGIVVAFRDDTKRREAELALQLRSAIVDSSDDAMISKNLNGIITSWNRGAEVLFGYNASEAIGRHITLIVPPDRRDEEKRILEQLHRGERIDHFETVRVRKDGELLNISVTISPIKDSTGRVVGASKVGRDVTERKRIERELRESEERFRAIIETTPECVKLVSGEGTLLHMNSSGLTMVGADCPETVVGKNVYDLIAPHDRDRYRAFNEKICRGEKGSLGFDIMGLGGVLRHMETHAAPFRTLDGSVVQLAVTRDVTERTRAERELRSSEERLRALAEELEVKVRDRTRELDRRNAEVLVQSEQVRELSNRLVQSQDDERRRISRELHDGVGQLLVALSMNVSKLAGEKGKLSQDASRSLDESAGIIEQASQEVRTMSYLLHPPLLEEIGLESALRWYVEGFAERSNIAVEIELSPVFSKGLPRDHALALFRIVQECLTNVHRHSRSLTAFVRIDRSSDEITLEIRDQGNGIPAEVQEKIISGQSSGVGLRGLRERIRQFGGRIEVHSNQGGTRIIAVLPVPELQAETSEEVPSAGTVAPAPAALPDRGVATILCIDDEIAGLLPRKLLLESAGHRVIEARSGAEGIRRFESEKVDAVILDYWMSGMKGTAVASKLKEINPFVPIIVLSGMPDLPGEAVGVVDQWLVKGTTRAEQLLDSINDLLDRRLA